VLREGDWPLIGEYAEATLIGYGQWGATTGHDGLTGFWSSEEPKVTSVNGPFITSSQYEPLSVWEIANHPERNIAPIFLGSPESFSLPVGFPDMKTVVLLLACANTTPTPTKTPQPVTTWVPLKSGAAADPPLPSIGWSENPFFGLLLLIAAVAIPAGMVWWAVTHRRR
jgi:hypothetical protein